MSSEVSESLTTSNPKEEHTEEKRVSNSTDTDDATDVPAVKGAKPVVEEERGVEIIDETPVNMLIRVTEDDGSKTTVNKAKNARNELLYKHGMYDLVYGQGQEILTLSQEPHASISSHEETGTFTVRVNDEPPIETPPSMEGDVLNAVRRMVNSEDGDIAPLTTIHATVMNTQVRRNVLNRLLVEPPFSVFVERGALEEVDRGWLIHEQLLLTWEGEFRNQSNEERRYEVSGSGVRQVESVNQAFDLSRGRGQQDLSRYEDPEVSTDPEDRITVEFGDATHTFGQREIDFVSRVVWALKNVRPRGPKSKQADSDTEEQE